MIDILKITTGNILMVKSIKGDLESLQHEVGGYISLVPYFKKLEERYINLYADDEGLLKPDPTITLVKTENNAVTEALVGNLIFTGYNDEGETLGLTNEQITFLLSHIDPVEIKGINKETGEVVTQKCFTFNF